MTRDPYRQPFVDEKPVHWQQRSACRDEDPRIFHPRKGESPKEAKAICETCTVQQECLDAALAHEVSGDHGVWGGTTQHERRVLRRPIEGLPSGTTVCRACGNTFARAPRANGQTYCSEKCRKVGRAASRARSDAKAKGKKQRRAA